MKRYDWSKLDAGWRYSAPGGDTLRNGVKLETRMDLGREFYDNFRC